MKRTMLTIALLLVATTALWAREELTDNDYVEVTLNDGSKVQGYLYDHWWKGIYATGEANTKFSIVEKADDGKEDRDEYTVRNVLSVVFTRQPGQPRWESCTVAYFDTEQLMNLLSSYKYMLMEVKQRSPHATLYHCQLVEKSAMAEYDTSLGDLWAVKFDGNLVTYPFVKDGKVFTDAMYHHLKGGKNGKFLRYVKNYFKKKKNKKAVEQNPAEFLNVYETFLTNNSADTNSKQSK